MWAERYVLLGGRMSKTKHVEFILVFKMYASPWFEGDEPKFGKEHSQKRDISRSVYEKTELGVDKVITMACFH